MRRPDAGRLKMFLIPAYVKGQESDSHVFKTWLNTHREKGWRLYEKGNEWCLFEEIK